MIKKVEEIYKETEVTVRIKRGYTERFWTKKGVKQECVMSSPLFNIYMAKVEEDFRKRKRRSRGRENKNMEPSVRGRFCSSSKK